MTHYEARLQADLDALTSDIAALASDVDIALKGAVRGLLDSDRDVLNATVLGDHPINRKAEAVEASAHRFIARHLPSAGHLRFVSSVLRIVVILERMGDYATTIAREAKRLTEALDGSFRDEVVSMAADAFRMFELAIKAFTERDEVLARSTMQFAKQVDRDFATAFAMLVHKSEEEISGMDLFSRLAIITRLERVSDQAKNLCEQTVFAVTGETKNRRPMRLLFLGQDDSGTAQLAKAIVDKQAVGRAVADAAGTAPVSSLSEAMVAFLERHGFAATAPVSLDDLDRPVGEYDVLIGLGVDVHALGLDTGYGSVELAWTLPAPSADIDVTYRELATRIADLVDTLRGPEKEA